MASPLVIAGSGRSGTTWVLDAIATANNLKTVFEPLHQVVGNEAEKYAGMYVRPTCEDSELGAFMDTVLAGKLHALWTDYRTLPNRLLPEWRAFLSPPKALELYRHYKNLWNNYKKKKLSTNYSGVAVKVIRANLMLEWLVSHYDVNVLFVIRHPCAVIESKIRLDAAAKKAGLSHGISDWDPQPLLNRYLGNKEFQEDFIVPCLGEFREDIYTEVEAHALIWCLENVPVLMKAQNMGICVTSYEHLVINGEVEWPRIAAAVGLENIPEGKGLVNPSQQASEDFRQHASDKTGLARWQDRMNEITIAEISNILGLFDVDLYSVYDPMPRKNVIKVEQERHNN